jgi:hypothetical protein
MWKHIYHLVLKWSKRIIKLIQLGHALKILWDMVSNYKARYAPKVEVKVPTQAWKMGV